MHKQKGEQWKYFAECYQNAFDRLEKIFSGSDTETGLNPYEYEFIKSYRTRSDFSLSGIEKGALRQYIQGINRLEGLEKLVMMSIVYQLTFDSFHMRFPQESEEGNYVGLKEESGAHQITPTPNIQATQLLDRSHENTPTPVSVRHDTKEKALQIMSIPE